MKKIKLNLYLSVILEAVKAETSIKGRIDRASNPQAVELAYQETAGDETMHERKLIRGIYTSVDKLKTSIIDYVESSGATTADNYISSAIDETEDTITLTLTVSDRFNTAMSDTLARLCSKFIEDNTLIYWWGATGVQSQVVFYQSLLADDLSSILRSFTKKSTEPVTIPYTSAITVAASTITMQAGEEEAVTYTIDSDTFDDIEAVVYGRCAQVMRQEKSFTVKALHMGVATLHLYSVHDDSVTKDIEIVIADEDGHYPDHQNIRHL